MKPTFDHTVGILAKAYLNGTLVHGNCYACAVGNIVAESMGYKFINCLDDPRRKIVWDVTGGAYDSNTPNWFTFLGCNKKSMPKESQRQISSTGYTSREIQKIERAFERCDKGESEDEYMFNGLMAVVNVLAKIHNVDLTVKDQAKKLFIKI